MPFILCGCCVGGESKNVPHGVPFDPPRGRERRGILRVLLGTRGLKAPRRDRDVRAVLSPAFGSGSDRSWATGCQIVAPQRDGEGDDGEPSYDDCPRLGT